MKNLKKFEPYTCAICKQVFLKIIDDTWDDEKAAKESEELFGEPVDENTPLVCDDCFKEFMIWFSNDPAKTQEETIPH